jgi:hypothetical protein
MERKMPSITFKPEILDIHPVFDPPIRDLVSKWKIKTYVDILVVVDGGVLTGQNSGFGVGRVIDLIRNTRIGCMRFRVDIARRSYDEDAIPEIIAAPDPFSPKYNNFKFDMEHPNGTSVLNKYEQVWCFGFGPGNSGSTDDADIEDTNPVIGDEWAKLDDWMSERKGGVFGTGDHHFLGASMCKNIPRLGTMRRWTNDDGVPPQGGITRPNTADRIDTLRPPSADYEPGASPQLSMGNTPHQGDLTVQRIQWVPEQSHWNGWFGWHQRPHPVLCHPTMGPINVMPDHAHEGLCVPNPDLTAPKAFSASLEYPDATDGGPKPAPKIIAYGSNLGTDAPNSYRFVKGDQPARSNNPMIAVYDGHDAGVGRVATDSTWHHWMNVNIDQIANADTDDWKKIKRYFQNLAVWLCPPGYSTNCLYLDVFVSHFRTIGFQDYYRKAPAWEIGEIVRADMHKHYGKCWVTATLSLIIRQWRLVDFVNFKKLSNEFSGVRLDGDLLENLVLGRMVQATMKQAEEIKAADGNRKKLKLEALPEPEEFYAEYAKQGLDEYFETSIRKCEQQHSALKALMK